MLAAYNDTIVWTIVVTDVSLEDIGSISHATSGIRVILARAPHPDLSLVNVRFARRMPETHKPTRENRNGVLQVGYAGKPATKSTVDIAGEVFVSYLFEERVSRQAFQLKKLLFVAHTRGSP